MINNEFGGNEFAAQAIARGSFVDFDAETGEVFVIDTTVLRLNQVALNGYIWSACSNCRECYKDGEEGEREWREHKAKKAEMREAWENSIKEAVGLTNSAGSVCITQSVSEVFTVVHIWERGTGEAVKGGAA